MRVFKFGGASVKDADGVRNVYDVLQKVGFNFMEDYPDENGVIWKWWQLKNLEFRNQNLER